MQIGSLTVELLSEGRFEVFRDGHINRSLSADEENVSFPMPGATDSSSLVGINPILVKEGACNILLDSGLGWGLDAGSRYEDVSNIRTNLDIFGLKPSDISYVILTHLHYDHAAGCSFTDHHSRTRATFPNATYVLHRNEWQHALSQVQTDNRLPGVGYRLDELYRLKADGCIRLLREEQATITEAVSVRLTGGHTPGHLAVRLQSDEESAWYPGDLLPSSSHLNRYGMKQLDWDPIQAKKAKVQLLRRAFGEQAMLLLYHSRHGQSGRLVRDEDKQYVLADIPKR